MYHSIRSGTVDLQQFDDLVEGVPNAEYFRGIAGERSMWQYVNLDPTEDVVAVVNPARRGLGVLSIPLECDYLKHE